MRSSRVALVVVALSFYVPFLEAPAFTYLACLRDLGMWTAVMYGGTFLAVKWALRRAMEVALRVPGMRLEATHERR